LKKLINGFDKERNLLAISSIFVAVFIIFGINFEFILLTRENILLAMVSLTIYYTIRLIIEWIKAQKSLAVLSISLLISFSIIGYILYELSTLTLVWDFTVLLLIILLAVGEFVASILSLNIEYMVYRRSDEESLKSFLPKVPFAVRSVLKYIPIGLLLLLITSLTSQFVLKDPVSSFWFIILLMPFCIHLLALGLYFIFLDKDYIDAKLKILDEQDKDHLLSDIGIKLANKDSKFCRKTNAKQYQTVMHFLENGLDPNEVFENRYTLLLPSSCCGDDKLVKLLIKHGADVNFVSSLGATALILASGHGSFGLVELLLKNGADKNIKDANGKTALNHAKENGFEDIVRILSD